VRNVTRIGVKIKDDDEASCPYRLSPQPQRPPVLSSQRTLRPDGEQLTPTMRWAHRLLTTAGRDVNKRLPNPTAPAEFNPHAYAMPLPCGSETIPKMELLVNANPASTPMATPANTVDATEEMAVGTVRARLSPCPRA
jgi:hypothetical protein